MRVFPQPFLQSMLPLLKTEYDDFISALQENPITSVRLNPNKMENELHLSNPVPWNANGFYLQERPSFTLDPFFHAGHYYPQESSSMILAKIIESIDLPEASFVLDMCGAPGGKSTILLDSLSSNSILHTHDVVSSRAVILKQNIQKWGNANCMVTTGRLENLVHVRSIYDLVVIDAPCSGEGMFRKENEAIQQWSERKIQQCCYMQSTTLLTGIEICKPGGFIIYSTCTYNKKENEFQIKPFIDSGQLESIEFPYFLQYNLNKQSDSNINTYRCFPHKTRGEGFTFSILKKNDAETFTPTVTRTNKFSITKTDGFASDWIVDAQNMNQTILHNHHFMVSEPMMERLSQLSSNILVLHAGIAFGQWKGKDFFPAHGLGLSNFLSSSMEALSLSKEEALQYLRAYSPRDHQSQRNWILMKYKSAKLGWAKNISGKLKNYLPKDQRIKTL